MKRKRGSSSVTEKSAYVVKVIKKMDTADPINVHVSPKARGIRDIDSKTGQVKTELVELDSPESKKQEVEEENVDKMFYELREEIKKMNKMIKDLQERQGEWVQFNNMMQRMFPHMIPPSRRQNQLTNDNPKLL